MYKIMIKEGRKKPKVLMSVGGSSAIDVVLKVQIFAGMDITHHSSDFVEVTDGKTLYYTEKV